MMKYPEDWKMVKLGDVAETSSGGTPSRNVKEFYQGDIKWFTTSELRDCLLWDSTEHISKEALKNSSAKIFASGTLLMAMYGATIGRLGLLSVDAATNQACCAIKCNSCDTKFLYYFLFKNRSQIVALGSGAGQPNISQAVVKCLQIPLPPSVEQKRIAEVLSNVDRLIENTEKRIAKKRAIKQGAMQELLTGKKRLPGFTGEWKMVKLGEIGKLYGGLSSKTAKDFGQGNARFITFLNVLSNVVINVDQMGKVCVGINEKQNKVKKGDLFFNISSETPEEVAMCAVLLEDVQDVYLNSFCCGFRMNDCRDDSLFISYYFNSEEGRKVVKTCAQGLTRYNLSKKTFLAMSITWPQLAEQRAIAKLLSDMDDEISMLERKLEKLKSVKQGMMQDLLTGKIRLRGQA